MSLSKKIGIILFYAIIILLLIHLSSYLVDAMKITASGLKTTLKSVLYLIGVFIGLWIVIYLWDNYGKKMSDE